MQRILLSVISGILLILSFPKFNLSFIAWISLVPLLFAIQGSNTTNTVATIAHRGGLPGKSGLKSAFLLGVLTGVIFYCGLLYWLIPTFTAAGESWILGLVCLLLLSIYLAIYIGLFCIGVKVFLSRRLLFRKFKQARRLHFTFHISHFVSSIFAASLWVSLEYIRSYLFTGFPWGVIGYSQWNFLPIIQIADITGVCGVSFLVVVVNATIVQLIAIKNATPNQSCPGTESILFWRQASVRVKIKNLIVPLTVFVLSLVYGFFRLSPQISLCEGNKSHIWNERDHRLSLVKVAVLQGNVDQYKKWDQRYVTEIIDTYTKLVMQAKLQNPDLIIWPESAIPGYLLYDRELYNWVLNLIKETSTYHLIGTVDHDGGQRLFNSAILFSPTGELLQAYRKIHLVPFGEAIPLKEFLGKYIKVVNELGDFSSGKEFTVFNVSLPATCCLLSANICFESIFPYISRKFTKNGARFLVNITNDAWFLKTSAPYQHFAFSVFRAIENRRVVVRSANTGISGMIDSSGRIFHQTEIFKTAFRVFYVQPEIKKTFYTHFGDLFAIICLCLTVICFLKSVIFVIDT